MRKPFITERITQSVIAAGAAIKPGTATKLCKVAGSPYFQRKLKARRHMRDWASRVDAGYCLDRISGEN